jgi:[protein-PII] uridylyltransferase
MNNYKNRLIDLRNETFIRQRPLGGLQKVQLFSEGIDRMLAEAYALFLEKDNINKQVCLIALGGYGRGELCPYSDIDILFLHSENTNKDAIAAAVRSFWDMGLNLGCVVRSVAECGRILGDDFATDTALLQARFIAGNKRLFHQLETAIVRPYFEKTRKRFLSEIRQSVHDGIFSSDNTLYRTEPDIKNGICTLRDCQRIMWAERVLAGSRSIWDLYHLSHFGHADVAAFFAAYEFLIAVRCELHLVCGQRIDVLESGLQENIAQNLGFGASGAGSLMEAFFRAVRTVKYFALSFLEKRLESRSLLGSLRLSMSGLEVKKGIMLLDGILMPSKKGPPASEIDPLWLVDIFRLTQVYQAFIGVELGNRMREAMQRLPAQDFRTPAVDRAFLAILSQEKGAGRVLGFMHETGVLAGLIPAFSSLTCKVEYDSLHEFTVDQHILLAMRALDELDTDADLHVRSVYMGLANKLPLRLALLLHDAGKAMPGDHVANGTIIAGEMCDRLGISEADKRTVLFLVYNHLGLSRLAFDRELDNRLVEDFAHRVGGKQNLDMLYILTVLDIRHVGSKTWTAWRASLLEIACERVRASLADPDVPARPVSGTSSDSTAVFSDILPEDEEKQAAMLDNLNEKEFLAVLDTFAGFDRLSVLSFDRIGFFADITGCISSEGYNILSARATSTASGKVLDIFHLEQDGATGTPSQDRVENIKKKWRLLGEGAVTAEKLIADRMRLYPPKKERGILKEPAVLIENGVSDTCTVLEIEAQDRFGLLYRIARSLSSHNVNIVSARLSTRIDRAVDTFYVNGPKGEKITDTITIERIKNDLIKAVSGE